MNVGYPVVQNTYRGRNAWFICDRCGQRHRRSRMLTEWDNLKVDRKCLDPRPPQMMPPNVYPEGIPFPDARPPQDNSDRLMDDTYLQNQGGGMFVRPGQGVEFSPPYLTTQSGEIITDEQGHPILVTGAPFGEGSVILNPGALSPEPITETIPIFLVTESGSDITTEGGLDILAATTTPQGPNVLADDVTFITGLVFP